MHGASWQVLSRGESLPCWRMSVIDTEKMYFCRGEGFSLVVECLLEQFILRCVPSSASDSLGLGQHAVKACHHESPP